MNAGVAVTVRHVDVAIGVGQHLGRVIKRFGGALDEPVGDIAGVEWTPRLPNSINGSPSKVNDFATEIGAIGGVDGVADDFQTDADR